MEPARQRKPVLTLRKNIPVSNPAPTPNVEPNHPQTYPDFTEDHATADVSPLEWLEVDEYYSQRKKPRNNKRTQRAEQQSRKESRWQ